MKEETIDFSPAVQLNLNVRGMRASATVSINERSAALARAGKRILRLGLGQSPFPVPEHVAQALRDNVHQKDYLPVRGLPALRAAVAAHYARTQDLHYDPAHVLIGPGTKELMFIVQLTYYGDLVIPSPSWVSYAPQARIIGRHLHWLPTRIESGLGVTPEALEALCRDDPDLPRLLILNYPGNPTGMVYADAQLEAIAAVARRYRVLILADEIYSGLAFSGQHTSIARFYPEGTIISNGLSKWCGAGGWRLGACLFPPTLSWLLEAMSAVASETYTAVSAPIQYAAVEGFSDSPAMREYLRAQCRILEGLCRHATAVLRLAGAAVAEPRGGFYLFPNFDPLREGLARRGIDTSAEFCERLLEDTGVACLPGNVFGRPPGELSVRLACVDFDGAAALAAVRHEAGEGAVDAAFLRAQCGPVMQALERLAAWVTA